MCRMDLAQCCFLALRGSSGLSASGGRFLSPMDSPPLSGERKMLMWDWESSQLSFHWKNSASGKTGYRVYPLGLSPYNLSLVRFGCENSVPRIASEGLCPSVRAHRCRGKLNLQAFFKGQKRRKNTDIAKDIFLFTNDMNKIVIY